MNLSVLVSAGEKYEHRVVVALVRLGERALVSQEDCVLPDSLLSQVVEAARNAVGEPTDVECIDLLYQADGVPVRDEQWCVEKFNRHPDSRKLKLETGETWWLQWSTPHKPVAVIAPQDRPELPA